MIKSDVTLFFGGLCGVMLGAVLIETGIGALLFMAGLACMTAAPVVTVVEHRAHRRGGDVP